MFNWSRGKETGVGDSHYDESDPLSGISHELSYQDCLNIYKYWPMGIRIVSSLPNFALSVGRKINFGEYPKECIDRFNEVYKELRLNEIIKQHCYNVRIFGSSSILIQTDDENYEKSISMNKIRNSKHLRFIHCTPFMTAGSIVEINPLDKRYLEPITIKVTNTEVHLTRMIWTNNNEPQYLQWTPSSYNYAGRSVFANMVDLIKYWNRSLIALQRIATKAGGIIVKNRSEGSLLNSITMNTGNKFLETIRNMTNDGIASIAHNDEIEFFALNGTSEVELIINKFNECLQLALNDTPTAILLDERLAKGFGNGEEDFKALLIAVESFRNNILSPIFDRIDEIVCYRAFDNDFLDSLRAQYKSDLKKKSNEQILLELIDEFSYEWEPLYPESEASRQDNLGRKLDNLMKLRDLGVAVSDIEEILNSDDEMYEQDLTLEEPETESEAEMEDDSYVSSSEVSAPTGDESEDG